MKRLEFTKPHDLNYLHGELLAALGPELQRLAEAEYAEGVAAAVNAAKLNEQMRAALETQAAVAELQLQQQDALLLSLNEQLVAMRPQDPALLGLPMSDQAAALLENLTTMRDQVQESRDQVRKLRDEAKAIRDPQAPDVTIRVEDSPDPDDDVVWIVVPDAADEAAIQAVIDAHDVAAATKARADKVAAREQDLAVIAEKAQADPAFAALARVLRLA